jgi:hypothetical protein
VRETAYQGDLLAKGLSLALRAQLAPRGAETAVEPAVASASGGGGGGSSGIGGGGSTQTAPPKLAPAAAPATPAAPA